MPQTPNQPNNAMPKAPRIGRVPRRSMIVVVGVGALAALWLSVKEYPFGSAAVSPVVVECSSVLPGTTGCDAVKLGVVGDWLSNGQKAGASVKYTFDHAVFVTGVSLANRGAVGSDILDGHLEFDNSRFPVQGGLGPINLLTEPMVQLPKSVKTTTVQFVVDKVSDRVGDVGLALFDIEYTDPQQEDRVSLSVTCSTQRPDGDLPCSNALPGAPGVWWSENEHGRDAWIQIGFASKGKKPVQPKLITGVKINEFVITEEHNNPGNIILDGHFVLNNGEESTRFPKEGGIGALAQYRGKLIPIDPPTPVTSVRFVVDAVPETNRHVGIEEFDLVVDPTRVVLEKTNQYLAVTIVSDGATTGIETIRPVELSSAPRPETQGLYLLQTLTKNEKIIDEAAFTPVFRDIITTFTATGPDAASVQQETARTILYVPYHDSIQSLKITNTLTKSTEDEKTYSAESP